MSISSSIDSKKALLFLKNSVELNQFTVEILPNSLESWIKSLVDESLKDTTYIFEKFIKDQVQQRAFLEKNGSSQQWRLIFAMYPDFCQSSLESVFRTAIQGAPSCSEEDVQQIYNCLKAYPGVDLHQIYTQHYKAEFLTWIQNQIYDLPPDSVLLILKIWRKFDQSIDQVWKKLLSLPDLNSAHIKELQVFQAKHSFVYKNYKSLQIIKLETTSPQKNIRISTSGKYLSQYILLAKTLDALLTEIAIFYLEKKEKATFCVLGFQKGSWEYQLLNNPRKISPKILIWRAKNILPLYQEKLKPLIEFLDSKAESLKKYLQEAQQNISELEYILEQIQEGIPVYGSSNIKGMKEVTEAKAKRDKTNKPIPKEQIETYLKNWKEKERFLQIELSNPIKFRENISHIEYLMKELSDSFQVRKTKPVITQNQIALIEKNQQELIKAECKSTPSQKKACAAPIKESDSDIEESSSSVSKSITLNTPALTEHSFTEIDAFLKDGGQVNGFLSKSIDGMLKQLKIHLLKTQVCELSVLQKEKIKEIHTHLVIATAALELTIQTIEDQRFDQVVLGFRSCLIHCHFAIEQMLSLKVLAKDGEMTITHNLIELAEKADLDRFAEQREFLKDIGIYLWFCYPEDYRSFYPKESAQPEPFIFLQKLSYLNKEGKLDLKVLKQAVQLCFSMYSQTIDFIIKASSFPMENLPEFLEKIEEVQKQIQSKIGGKHSSKRFTNDQTSLSNKCSQALGILLQSVNKLENNPNFEELLVPMNTIKRYLEFMQISLKIPQGAHSLQEFIQVETMLNMDKLFKHVFRTIILIQTGSNSYSHNLSELLQLTEKFYNKDLLTPQDQLALKDLNLSITHHYLHKKSSASLKRDYEYIWNLAHRLNLLSAKDFILMSKGQKISYRDLRIKKEEIFKKLETAFDLFIKVLNPVIEEIERLLNLPSTL